MTADVLGWEDVELNADLSQTPALHGQGVRGLSHIKDTPCEHDDFNGWITRQEVDYFRPEDCG